MCLNTWYLFEYVGIPIAVANHHYKYLQDYRRQFSTILDKSIYIDSASDLLNSPLPFHPFIMLTQGVSFLASNAQKQHCLSGEGDAYRYCLSGEGDVYRYCLSGEGDVYRYCLSREGDVYRYVVQDYLNFSRFYYSCLSCCSKGWLLFLCEFVLGNKYLLCVTIFLIEI